MLGVPEEVVTCQPLAVVTPQAQARVIWANIERLYKSRGWRQSELADRAKIPRPTVNRWKRNVPRPAALQKIADTLGVSVDQLLTEDGSARTVQEAQPVGHLNANESRVVAAMRNSEKLARVIRALVKEFGSEEDDG